ncbi:MAG: hypothetical protein GX234_07235 [Clostridiales bacterium]|nr:hypothetical protein [Clostridiales bacterium]
MKKENLDYEKEYDIETETKNETEIPNDSFDLDSDPDFEIEDLNEEWEEDSADEGDGRFSRKINFHFILIGLIAVVLIFAVVRLAIWSKGEKIEIDPNEDTSQFDVETEDYIMHVDPRFLEGHEDDGVQTILCLGNEPFASERGENGIARQLEQMLGENTVVYNAAFEGTTLSCQNSVYDEKVVSDAFCLYWLSKTITLQDFTLLDNAVDTFSQESPSAKEALDTLKSVDMNAVDTLLIFYDGQDYLKDRIITSPYDLSDIATYTGSLRESLTLLQDSYPHIRIIVLSPAFACQIGENGDYLPGSTTNTLYKNGFLSEYMIGEKNIAVEKGVTFIDNYYGTIHEDNYTEYLEDNIHLNDKGRTLAAERIVNIMGQ